MKLSISKTACLMNVSVRTLHYYDEIGILKPAEISMAGYRFYGDDEINRLQQIIFYRELEFSLSDIAKILSAPNYNPQEALQKHRELLLLKREHLDGLIELLDETIGGKIMSKKKTTLQEIKQTKEKYADEVFQKWGNTDEYKQSEEKYSKMSDSELEGLAKSQDEIFSAFANCVGKPAESNEVQNIVKLWQNHITKNYYKCSNEILAGLGEMYVADERFTKNLDKYGDGTAKLMSDAIKIYCQK